MLFGRKGHEGLSIMGPVKRELENTQQQPATPKVEQPWDPH